MSETSIRHRFDIFLGIFAFLFLVGAISSPGTRPQTAGTAAASHNASAVGAVSGFAWSETIGWVSMAHTNCDTNGDGLSDGAPAGCPPAGTPVANYAVAVNFPETGGDRNATGFAWSSNLGWIDFDPAGPYPAGGGTTADHAKLAANNTDIVGFARACSVFVSGCSGALKPDGERGGWDGWISMAGTAADASAYGVKVDATRTKLEGKAWGSDIVGWLDFAPAGFGGVRVIGPLAVSCTYDPGNGTNPESTNVGSNVTWDAAVTGGTGVYAYSWALEGSLTPAGPYTSDPQVVQYTATTPPGDLNAGIVTVTSGNLPPLQATCTGKNSGSTAGIQVLGAQNFFLSPNPVILTMLADMNYYLATQKVDVVGENNFSETVNLSQGGGQIVIPATSSFGDFGGSLQILCNILFNPSSVASPYAQRSDLGLSGCVTNMAAPNPTPKAGVYPFSNKIRGQSVSLQRFANLNVQVTAFSYPPLAASCTYSPDSVNLGESVTWKAVATGGKTPYTYSWSGDVSGSNSSEIVSYSTMSPDGEKHARVQITDAQGSSSDSGLCKSEATGTGDGPTVGTLPTLTGCAFSPASAPLNTDVTWTASGAAGGNGTYAYAWTLSGPPSMPAGPYTANPQTVRYGTGGTNYTGSVIVSSAGANSTPYTCNAAGDPGDTTLTITEQSAQFSLGAAPSSLAITTTGSFPTAEKSSTISIVNPQGLSGDVTLSAALPPALVGKATVSFQSDAVILSPYSATRSFKVRLDAAVPNGSYPIVITGANAGTDPDPTVTVTLTVNQFAPSFIEQ